MRIEGAMQSLPAQGDNSVQTVQSLRQQLQRLEQEHSRLSEKQELSEAERKRKEQLECEIERLRQQLQQMEQKRKQGTSDEAASLAISRKGREAWERAAEGTE